MQKNFISKLIIFFLLLFVFTVNTNCSKGNSNPAPPVNIDTTPPNHPAVSGKLIYHQYNSYGDASKLFLYDFASNKLTWISENWNIYDPINAHFNDDGSQIVFMGEAVQNGKWNIYIWTVGAANPPTNLTTADGCRDEDPKFSPDGLHICFKQTSAGGTGNLKIMDLSGNITNNVSSNTIESGMPYYTHDGTALVYAKGAGGSSDIFMINIDGTNNHALCNAENIEEYYPIVMSDSTFLYTRWYNSSGFDQVYVGYFVNNTRTRLPFNTSNADYSDAFPCGDKNVILSCDKAGGRGSYDLYIADKSTGKIWSLSSYNSQINTSLNELGSCYSDQ